MKTSKFQKLRNYLRQVFQAGSNSPKNIPLATGLKKTPKSVTRHTAGDREARLKKSVAPKADTEPNHHRHSSDNFSSESQAYKNFR